MPKTMNKYVHQIVFFLKPYTAMLSIINDFTECTNSMYCKSNFIDISQPTYDSQNCMYNKML